MDTAGNTIESGDNQGNKTLNTYDANNNLIATESYKEGTLTNKSQTKYDSKNRVIATIDSFGNKTTTTYNAKGQKSQTTDALGRVTTYEYNALGQLIKETNPEGKTTEYSYNTKGQKTKVVTPNKAEFGFSYDALQRVTKKANPDRGETTYTYDISDNIASETNAKGETKSYTYDVANRKTSVSYSSDATLNETYEYDKGDNAKGKLTQITDASGSTSFTYDAKGNITSKIQVIADKTFTTSYTYNEQDKLESQTYPSGKVLTYDYNAQGELESISIDGNPFIADIQTNQNGLVSYTYADGTTHTREYDTNGRVTKLIYPNYTEVVNYNAVSNITSITADEKTKQFDYDLVDRLTSYEQNATAYQHFTYDANGNRLTQNQETNKTRRFSYLDNTNTLEGIKYYHTLDENTTTITKDINYTYDKTGNIISDGTHTYTYDGRNRLVKVDENVTYQYNYDNKRVSKTINNQTTYYIYEAHKLVGEYQEDGTATKEYVYYNDTPIAIIDSTDTYKIYADHLDTPRRVADSANNIVWSWESKPFGEDKPTGTYILNLRFPGQYFDTETNTHYNINRDYNPTTGRYIQPDPIGFDGGVNTFGYVNGNPVFRVDFFGLDWIDSISDSAARNFAKNIIRPTLDYLGSRYGGVSVEQLLLGTALQESGGLKWRKQLGSGPALSYYQIEPATMNDRYRYSSVVRTKVDALRNGQSKLHALQYNDKFATALARLIYYSKPGKIPNDINGQAAYWKKYYNTYGGAGTTSEYLEKWNKYVKGYQTVSLLDSIW